MTSDGYLRFARLLPRKNDQPNEEEDWDLKIQNDEKAVEVSNGKKDDSDWEKEKSDDDWIGNLTAQV